MTDFLKVKNRAVTSLAKELLIGDTIMEVVDTSAIPSEGRFRLTVEDEIVEVTDVDGGSLTIIRGVEGTTPIYHANGRTVSLNITAGIIEELQGAIGEGGAGVDIAVAVSAGDTLVHSNDEERSSSEFVETKIKEIRLGASAEGLRVKVDGRTSSSGGYHTVNLKKNGSNLATMGTADSTTYKNFSRDIGAVSPGDTLEIYVRANTSGITGYARNFRLYASKAITYIGEEELATPLPVAGAVNLSATNQDP